MATLGNSICLENPNYARIFMQILQHILKLLTNPLKFLPILFERL
jgi:hypothetical protein